MISKFIKNNYSEILTLLNQLKVGVYITDRNGNTILLNDESCKTGGLTREQVMGKNMKELESMGFVENSASVKVLKSGKMEEIIQNLGDGNKVFVTGSPVYEQNNIDIIVCTERDITETLSLQKLLEKEKDDKDKSKEEANYLRKQNITLWGNLVAEDDVTKRLVEDTLRIAKMDVTVLLTGDSGTGKEVFANFIYQNSSRAGNPFIKVNCAAIPDNLVESELFGYEPGSFTGADRKGKRGLFEIADGGTLFLDEIGEVPLHLQAKLLRAIQEKEILRIGGTETIKTNIRLIAATNSNLEDAVKKGTFRGDLFYRLNVMPIHLNPLKGRKKDIAELANDFVERFNIDYRMNKKISLDALEVLQKFDYPGNIRELENIIERVMIGFDGDMITKFQIERALGVSIRIDDQDYVEDNIDTDKTMKQILEEYEKGILKTMMASNKRASDVARALDMNKSTLHRRLKKYDLL